MPPHAVDGAATAHAGATDARFLINQAKIPSVIFGPGDLYQAHTTGEHVDTELLRVAAVWTGNAISPESIAMFSYPLPLKKMAPGQKHLPRPRGEVRAHNGLYPGWQAAGAPAGCPGVRADLTRVRSEA